MTNRELFYNIFGIYSSELWAMPEEELINWQNSKAFEPFKRGRTAALYWEETHTWFDKDFQRYEKKFYRCSQCGAITTETNICPRCKSEIIRIVGGKE